MLARKDTEKFPRFFKVVGKYPDFQVFKSCQSKVAFHVETSHLICSTNQMPGLYMKHNTVLKWVKYLLKVNNNSNRWCKIILIR